MVKSNTVGLPIMGYLQMLLETKNNKKGITYSMKIIIKNATKYGYHNVKIIGAPFIYFPNILKKNKDQSPKSLILFPLHSHEFGPFRNIFAHYKHYIKEIDKIKHYFNFITVCSRLERIRKQRNC